MKSIFLKQQKPLKVKILYMLIFMLTIYLIIVDTIILSQIMTLLGIGLILLGYSVSYEIKKDFENHKHIMFFGFSVFKEKLVINFPEYISVFSASFKQDNTWGAVSAIGTKQRQDAIVIRFFSDTTHFTVFKTSSHTIAFDNAKKLKALLDVEIRDATKK